MSIKQFGTVNVFWRSFRNSSEKFGIAQHINIKHIIIDLTAEKMIVWSVTSKNSEAETETFTTETKYNKETGFPLVQFVRCNGQLQAPPDGSPSYTLFDRLGRPKLMNWQDQDELHREDAGASIDIDPETGVHYWETFYTRGQPRPALLGPFRITRDPATGEKISEQAYGEQPVFPQRHVGPAST